MDPAAIRARLIDLARAAGCQLDEATAEAGFAGTGVTNDLVVPVVEGMVAAGEAVLSDERRRLTLTPVLCVGGDEAAGGPLGVLVAAAEARGCALTAAEVTAVLRGQGIAKSGIEPLIEGLVARGDAGIAEGVLTLGPGICGGGMPDAPPMEARRRVAASDWVQGRLAAAPGCVLPRRTLAAEGVAVSIGPTDLDLALADLARENLAAEAERMVALAPAACAAGLDDAGLVRALGFAFDSVGCRLDRADPEAEGRLRRAVALVLGVAPPDVDAFLQALGPRLDAALDNPGAGVQIDGATGELIATDCAP